MGSKKLQVWLPLLFSLVMVAGMWIGFKLREDTAGPAAFFKNNRSSDDIREVVDLIKNRYVDNVGMDSITDSAINGLLSELDPHSVFIPAKEVQMYNEDLQGNFQGIGIEFQIFNDTVNVLNVIQGGPSDKAGVQVGDKIITVNDTAKIAGTHILPSDIRTLLRGPGGSVVTITVLRDRVSKKIPITRGTIPLPSVDVSYMIAPKTGFIRINKFAETTYEEFSAALQSLEKKGMQKLILDLRGNSGGFLNEAVDVADEFLNDNKMIVYTEGSKVPRTEYHCKRAGLFETGKLAVLVDETTASASEILSGALQDWDRATLIGRRTFGKGLVQQQFTLSDGAAVRLTIARYYTPLGRNIQKPYNKGKEQYEEELIQRFHNGEVVVGDTTKPAGKAYKTPEGHVVYGGGGITPDIFVPFDTASLPRPVVELYYKGTLNNYVYHYYINHKDQFQNIKSAEQLKMQYNPGEKDWQQVVSFAKRDSINLDTVSAKAKEDVLKKLPAFLARQIWRTEGYFEVTNPSDPMIKKALEVLSN